MRIHRQTILKKIRLSFILGTCLVAGVTQSTYTQTVVDEKRQIELTNQLKEQRQMFGKVSSTEKPADDGNRIVAIRRIKLHFQDVDKNGFEFDNQKDLIEIEVFSILNIPIGNAADYLVIGDMAFESLGMSGDCHSVFVHLTPEEFGKVKDGSIISFVISGGTLNDDY